MQERKAKAKEPSKVVTAVKQASNNSGVDQLCWQRSKILSDSVYPDTIRIYPECKNLKDLAMDME